MEKEAKIAEKEICKFLAIFLCKCKMPITDIVKTYSYLVAGKWKTFYTQRRVLGPIFITNPILNSALTNTSALHYGLSLIQPSSRVTATSSNSIATSSSSTATSSMVRTISSMVTETKSVVLFRF